MPNFSHPFAGNNSQNKLSANELVRALRFSLSSELEAIQVYEQLSESTDDSKAKKLLLEIADDEREHVGNFAYLIKLLSPIDEKFYLEGISEAKELLKGK